MAEQNYRIWGGAQDDHEDIHWHWNRRTNDECRGLLWRLGIIKDTPWTGPQGETKGNCENCGKAGLTQDGRGICHECNPPGEGQAEHRIRTVVCGETYGYTDYLEPTWVSLFCQEFGLFSDDEFDGDERPSNMPSRADFDELEVRTVTSTTIDLRPPMELNDHLINNGSPRHIIEGDLEHSWHQGDEAGEYERYGILQALRRGTYQQLFNHNEEWHQPAEFLRMCVVHSSVFIYRGWRTGVQDLSSRQFRIYINLLGRLSLDDND